MTSSPKKFWRLALVGICGVLAAIFGTSLALRFLFPPVNPTIVEGEKTVAIQVEIVNSSGQSGAGKHTMRWLRQRGFDVVELRTASKTKKSMIVDRLGDRVSAKRVASALGIADSLIVSTIDSMLFVRASVILGEDLRSLEPFLDNE
jgi:hypothetical protein